MNLIGASWKLSVSIKSTHFYHIFAIFWKSVFRHPISVNKKVKKIISQPAIFLPR